MTKKDAHPCTAAEFEALYFAHLSAPDQPTAYNAYLRAEAAVMLQYGDRKYKNYDTFKNCISKMRARARAAGQVPDKREALAGIIKTVNVYLYRIDLPTLIRYQSEVNEKARNMEVFGPGNGSYNADELRSLKTTAAALDSLIKYIQNALS